MAGGIGNRFWPVSNPSCPKQFSDILHLGKSFIRQTYERIHRIFDNDHIFIVTGAEYENITHEQIPELPLKNILKEPLRRNTATCITYAAVKIRKIDPEATMVVIPSDHFITNDEAYLNDLQSGIDFVGQSGGLLTIGIEPSRAETQYGYIQIKNQDKNERISAVKTFTEKPDMDLAIKFYESGEFLWNAGIFIWKVADILEEIKKHIYDLYALFEKIPAFNTPQEQEYINNIYGECPNLSIDVGIMEKSQNVYVLKDENNNSTNSQKVLFRNSRNCIVNVPYRKKVIVHGAEDLIIAENKNYLMICHIKDEDHIKHFEKQLKYKK